VAKERILIMVTKYKIDAEGGIFEACDDSTDDPLFVRWADYEQPPRRTPSFDKAG
jgi:hypothetical protein